MYLFFHLLPNRDGVTLIYPYLFPQVLLQKACENEGKDWHYFYFFLVFLRLHPLSSSLNSPLPRLLQPLLPRFCQ